MPVAWVPAGTSRSNDSVPVSRGTSLEGGALCPLTSRVSEPKDAM